VARSLGLDARESGAWAASAELGTDVAAAGAALRHVAARAQAAAAVLDDWEDVKLRVPMVTQRSVTPEGRLSASLVCLRTWTKARPARALASAACAHTRRPPLLQVSVQLAVELPAGAAALPALACVQCDVSAVAGAPCSEAQLRALVAATPPGAAVASRCAAALRGALRGAAEASPEAAPSAAPSLEAAVQQLSSAGARGGERALCMRAGVRAGARAVLQRRGRMRAEGPDAHPGALCAVERAFEPVSAARQVARRLATAVAAAQLASPLTGLRTAWQSPQGVPAGADSAPAAARPAAVPAAAQAVAGAAREVGEPAESCAGSTGPSERLCEPTQALTGPFPEGEMEATPLMAPRIAAPAAHVLRGAECALTPPACGVHAVPSPLSAARNRWHENPLFGKN